MALFCEAVSYEANGNMNVHGVFDQIVLDPFVVLPTRCTLKLAVSAVRGDAEAGPTPLGIRWESPDGSQTAPVNVPFQLPQSVPFTFASDVTATITQIGVYWLDLFLLEKLLTRIPLPVVRGEQPIQSQSAVVQ